MSARVSERYQDHVAEPDTGPDGSISVTAQNYMNDRICEHVVELRRCFQTALRPPEQEKPKA
jgi:hypothetical protein